MGRSSSVPPDFYTAGQAIKKLGIPRSTFYDMVERGQISKVIPPNKSDAWYPKDEIDKMAKAHQLFMLQYARDVSTFEIAQEEDIEDIADLNAELFGGSMASRYRLRMSQYKANQEIFHVLKQGEALVGYVGIFPLKHDAIEKIMSGIPESRFRIEVLSPENIVQFKPEEAKEAFVIIGTRQRVKKSKFYAARMITGSIEFLETLARRGVIIEKVYATSRTQDGIKLSNDFGFQRVIPSGEEDDLLRFELDLLNSSNPLLRKYQKLAKQTKGNHKIQEWNTIQQEKQ